MVATLVRAGQYDLARGVWVAIHEVRDPVKVVIPPPGATDGVPESSPGRLAPGSG
jgi:hypothetical protein